MTARVFGWFGVNAACLAIGLSGLAATAAAQPADWNVDRAEAVVPVAVAQVDVLNVSPGGGSGPGTRDCGQTSSLTDADFSGGSYTMQAGFAEGEWLAATYTLSAADFPIRIDLTECIFLVSNASVQTTTIWAVGFWEGTPLAGSQVAYYVADDLMMPYIRLGPGTAGANVQFSIDPGDPEQIIINDNGSHQFTMGYQIVQHNQQTQNPCFFAPPTCSNAFPCTDVSGLASAANNWLNGVNCGSFGCPPNGGWARFSTLSAACRPSGDWVMRCSWSPVNCQPGVGPCCLNGVCSVMTQTDCQQSGGTYQGDGTSCSGISCPPPATQACCFSNGGCLNLAPANCTGAGGTPGGPGTSCATYNCNPTGACCLPDGSCVGPVTPSQCSAQGGTFQGDGTSCGTTSCPQPQAACCFSNQFCLMLTQIDCTTAGGTWNAGATCADGNGNGTADACEAPPACPGDLDGDRDVDLSDLTRLLSNFGRQSGATPSDGDLDGDQDVDLSDLSAELSNFGRTC
ncbi:MAG: hypothetical protein HZB38_00295 [Planctomycetes bacterium]|nr:hypothetical protein [Planctomycetota bacterium]